MYTQCVFCVIFARLTCSQVTYKDVGSAIKWTVMR